jgi:uncharacterized protein
MQTQRTMLRSCRRAGFVLTAVLLLAPHALWALEVPRLQGRVNDYARLLSAPIARHLEAQLAELERTDSTQIVVLTIASLEGDSLEDFSIRVAEQWGIGQKGRDNGAILLIAKRDRKIRIEVGYGLEGKLTDLISGRIIRDIIGPQFKMGRFDQGVSDGVAAMIAAVRGEYAATQPSGQGGYHDRNGGSGGLFALLVFFFLLRMAGRIHRGLGAVVGGVIAPIAGLFFFRVGLLGALLLIPFGLLAGFLSGLFGSPLSHSHMRSRSRHTTFWTGGFGGGFSSGGFGGFSGGGGGFGGGGSSGGW